MDSIQVKLSGLELRRPRPFGNCWLASELWHQLGLSEFWRERLPEGRETVSWEKVLRLLVVNRLLEPGSEFRVHRHWFVESAMDALLEENFAVADKDRLYRCLDRVLEHKQDLFVWLKQKWAELFQADFEVLLYDLTSTYFEGEMEENPKAKRGYSRDSRPDCLQVVIALVVTPDGFPLAYEVMDGNTSEHKTLRPFLDHIEKTYGKARRVWVMDRGIPTEAILREMREPGREMFYLVGTPKGRINKHEKKWLDLPWQKVRESVQVKLYEHEGELYVLARSDGRQAKEIAMRRKRLARLLRKLRAMRRSLPGRDQLLLRIGAAKKEAGRAFGFVKIRMPLAQEPVTRETFSFRVDKSKLQKAQQRDGHYLLRSNLTAEDPAVLWTRYVQLTQIEAVFRSLENRPGDSPDLPSVGASRGRAHPDCVPGLLSPSHAEEPIADSRAGSDADGRTGKAGHHPDDRRVDSNARWALVDPAAIHATGQRSAASAGANPTETAVPAAAPNHRSCVADSARSSRSPTLVCGEDLSIAPSDSKAFMTSRPAPIAKVRLTVVCGVSRTRFLQDFANFPAQLVRGEWFRQVGKSLIDDVMLHDLGIVIPRNKEDFQFGLQLNQFVGEHGPAHSRGHDVGHQEVESRCGFS